MGNFKELKVWQKSKDLAVKIYKITDDGKLSKYFGLKDQMQRSRKKAPLLRSSSIGSPASYPSSNDFFCVTLRGVTPGGVRKAQGTRREARGGAIRL
jgi:hypothetical protein